MKIVFDASTLILLAKTELLREVTDEVEIIIPEKVKTECLSKESIDAILISTLIKEKKIAIEKAGNPKAVKKKGTGSFCKTIAPLKLRLFEP